MDTGTMRLTDEEKGMLRGEQGEAVKEALAYQIEVGNFFKAERFVPIRWASASTSRTTSSFSIRL